MMIPKVLLDLIDKYNEKGKFINFGTRIYWFNGKRFEFWAITPSNYIGRIFVISNELYHTSFDELRKYKHYQWFLIPWSSICASYQSHYRVKTKNDIYIGNYIDCHVRNFKTNEKLIFKGNYYWHYMIAFENTLYLFHSSGNNRKFDTITKKWIDFKSGPHYYRDIVIINNFFYCFNESKCFQYDPKTDQYSESFIEIPLFRYKHGGSGGGGDFDGDEFTLF